MCFVFLHMCQARICTGPQISRSLSSRPKSSQKCLHSASLPSKFKRPVTTPSKSVEEQTTWNVLGHKARKRQKHFSTWRWKNSAFKQLHLDLVLELHLEMGAIDLMIKLCFSTFLQSVICFPEKQVPATCIQFLNILGTFPPKPWKHLQWAKSLASIALPRIPRRDSRLSLAKLNVAYRSLIQKPVNVCIYIYIYSNMNMLTPNRRDQSQQSDVKSPKWSHWVHFRRKLKVSYIFWRIINKSHWICKKEGARIW